MNEVVRQVALAISGTFFAGLWEGALILAVVWLFLRAFPGIGASTRYAIWLSTLIAFVVAPVCTIVLSGQHESQALVAPVSAVTADSKGSPSAPAIAAPQPTERYPALPASPSAPALQHRIIDIPIDLSAALAALWSLIAGVRVAVLLLDLRKIAKLRHSAETLRVELGYTVLASQRTSVPLAIGFIHPAVVLPSSLTAELSVEAIEAIVMHEAAHLRRYDVWTNALARVLEALLALNPLAWLVLVRLSVEREVACDDWVVTRLDAGEVFAHALANLALRPAFASIGAPSAIGSHHALVARIEQTLDRRPRRLRLSAAALAGMLLLLTMFTTIIPPFSPVLAFTPQASASPNTVGCTDHPPLMQDVDRSLRPTGRWTPLKDDPTKASNPKNTVLDLTIDAQRKAAQCRRHRIASRARCRGRTRVFRRATIPSGRREL